MKEIIGVKLYERKEVEKLLGVSEITLRDYMKRGEIIPRKLGTRIFFTEQAILDFLNCKNGIGKDSES